MSYNTCEANTDRTEQRNRQIHNYSWKLHLSLSKIDKTTRQKISKAAKELTINQQDLIDIYTHATKSLETFFSSAHKTYEDRAHPEP